MFMRNQTKAAGALLLLCVMLFSSACSGTAGGGEGSKTSPESSGNSEAPDDLPVGLKFDGSDIVFHVRGDDDVIRDVFVSEEESGSPIASALYNKNRHVENRLDVKISCFKANPWQKYSESLVDLKASIDSEDGAFDVIAGWSAHIPTLAVDGYFLSLPGIQYLNLSQPWWNQSLNSELTIKDKLFFANGDISISGISYAQVFLFNKKLQNEFGVEDLYKTVLDGEWTIEKLMTYARSINKDNGDTVRDDLDIYGLAIDKVNAVDGFLQSSGIKMFTRDDSGLPVYQLEYDKVNELYDTVYSLCWGELPGAYSDDNEVLDEMFMSDRALLYPTTLMNVEKKISLMDTDYGIIPYPKYDANQIGYYTRPQDGVSLYCIPRDAKNTPMSGAVMEAMASESHRSVTEVYFEVAMKHRYSRGDGDDASKMLDMIRDGQTYCFASVYNNSIGRPWDCLRILMENPNVSFASWYAQWEKTINTLTERFVNRLDDML